MLIIIRLEGATQSSRHAKRAHEIRRYSHAVDSFRRTIACEIEVAVERCRQITKGFVLVAPVGEIAWRHRSSVITGDRFPNHYEAIRIGIRQWSKNDCVEDTEYRCVSTNSECERNDSNSCDHRVLEENADGVF